MAQHIRHFDVGRFFPHALLATALVVFLPMAIVAAVIAASEPDPSPWLTSVLSVVVAIAGTVLGSAFWMRRPESLDISFGELMLWGWLRRKRAEQKLEEGSRLLGLHDEQAEGLRIPRMTPQQQLQILHDLTHALESKDPYTHGHSRRVERHVYRTALAMGLSVKQIEDLRKAAALHDVGKIRVPERIVRKPGPLTFEERKMIEDHVSLGAWMVSKVGNADVVAAVRHHHERWDGRGYPDGLAGRDIPLFARIIAVADTYDAMTSTRPYRAGVGRDPAMDTLKELSGIQFDPAVVDVFLSTLPRPAAVPVAGLLLLLGNRPREILRETAVVLKRAGASSLAPATGAVGAAVILGASAITTPAIDKPQPPPAVQAQPEAATISVDPPDQVRGKRIKLAQRVGPVRALGAESFEPRRTAPLALTPQ
ncbi:MAG: HD-GYP domain-containing protein, partial [Actinomycetota bacterium]|nr:HD-GYP domain-containing protein [Actinomycetota bacterium]